MNMNLLNYKGCAVVYICIWGLEEPIEVIRQCGFTFNILKPGDEPQLCINLSTTPMLTKHSQFFWIYETPNIDVAKTAIEATDGQLVMCTSCNELQPFLVKATPWGRASDEGVRVETSCKNCGARVAI